MQFFKTKVPHKLVASLVTVALITQSSICLANEGIFFNTSTARKLAADIDHKEKLIKSDSEIIDALKQQNSGLFELSETYKQKTDLLMEDSKILRERGDKFEKAYIEKSEQLNECIDSKPSRFVWYGMGFLSAVLIGFSSLILLQ